MPDSPFVFELKSKLGWAERHLKQFQSLVDHHLSTRPNSISKHDDILNGRHVRRLYVPGIDIDLPLNLGVFVYSLRSTLDHIAWRLSRLTMPEPPKSVMFPIHDDGVDPESERIFVKKTKGIPPDAVLVIRDLQPYKRGTAFKDDPLWQLNELSNIDKHRIFAAHSTATDIFLHPSGYVQSMFDDGMEFSWPLSAKDSVVFEPYRSQLIFGKPVDLPGPPFEIRVSEIAEIHRYVRDDVVPRFFRFFP